MQKRLFALIGLTVLVSACGKASEDSFNKEFDTNFVSSCVSSAVDGGVPQTIASNACDCALKGINEKFGTVDKMTMSPEQAQPIMAECMTKAVQSNG